MLQPAIIPFAATQPSSAAWHKQPTLQTVPGSQSVPVPGSRTYVVSSQPHSQVGPVPVQSAVAHISYGPRPASASLGVVTTQGTSTVQPQSSRVYVQHQAMSQGMILAAPQLTQTQRQPVVAGPIAFNRRTSTSKSFSAQLAIAARSQRVNVDLNKRVDVQLDEDVIREIRLIFDRITASDGPGMSRLDLVKALQSDATVSAFLLPGFDCCKILEDNSIFEASQTLFNDISRGKPLINSKVFLNHFRNVKVQVSSALDLLDLFTKLDINGDGRITRHEILTVVKREPAIAKALLKYDVQDDSEMDDAEWHDVVEGFYKGVAGDWRYFDFADFLAYFRTAGIIVENCGLHVDIVRSDKTVLIIGPGFGARLNPLQTETVVRAGYRVHWLHDLPNPEENNFLMLPHVGKVKDAIDSLKPDLLMAGSKGGAYLVVLWQMGYWRGPTVMINVHPSCDALPKDVPIVLAQGDSDEVYTNRNRADFENLLSTGSPNMCFLYYSATSGKLASGHFAKFGDAHNMASLCAAECLPRLMDAAMSYVPELHMMRSWIGRMGAPRVDAERKLGLVPSSLQKHWVTRNQSDEIDEVLFEVPRSSSEFLLVSTVFKAPANDRNSYGVREDWDRVNVIRIQRIENTMQDDGGAQPYYNSLRKSFNSQGIEFLPGVHTRWLFHGSDAIESIVNNPVNGFQPLVSGTRGASLWGLGTYFARDAGYVASGPFCGQPAADGTRKMLLCLVTTGMSCVGDPNHRGVLPMRRAPHRYNSSVDSLASPEIFILQHPGAAYPAYLITFL